MKCTYRDKPGGPETCQLLTQDGSKYCPRHTFLHNVAAEKKRDKELAMRDGKRGLPADRAEMLRRGYVYTGNRACTESTCKKPIEWWRTPNGKMAPYDPMPDEASHSRSHYASCTRAASFRRTA